MLLLLFKHGLDLFSSKLGYDDESIDPKEKTTESLYFKNKFFLTLLMSGKATDQVLLHMYTQMKNWLKRDP